MVTPFRDSNNSISLMHAASVPVVQNSTTAPVSEGESDEEHSRLVLQVVHPEPRVFVLQGERQTIGRDPRSDIVLPSDAISRRHAEILLRGGALAVIDLRSRNGVAVDGRRIHEPTRLEPNSVLRLGDHVALVQKLGPSDALGFGQLRPGLWGGHRLRQTLHAALQVAATELPVLLAGESGTGKELVARAIHEDSQRTGRLVAVNCAALPEALLEAELFGHEKGAFTGAYQRREGHIERARGGTLFLDEVAELSLPAQAKLLRTIQERAVLPVGGRDVHRVDVRFVAATHRDLELMVERGSFRLDLFHRLAGARVSLPALRERRDDIVPLFRHFVTTYRSPSPELSSRFVEALCLAPWPGNVRQLQQLAHSMVALHGALPRWRPAQLPEEWRKGAESERESGAVEITTSKRPRDLDSACVAKALEEANGNVSQAARALGIARQSLYTLVREHGIDPARYR